MKFRIFVNKVVSTGIICNSFSGSFVSANKIDDVKGFLNSVVDTAYICSYLEAEKKYRKVVETRNDIYFSIFDGMIQQAKGVDELFAIVLLLPSKITFEHKKLGKKHLNYLKKKRVSATVKEISLLEDFLNFFNDILRNFDEEGNLNFKVKEELGFYIGISESNFTLEPDDLLKFSKSAFGKIFTSIEDIVNRFILNDALKFLLFSKNGKEKKSENLEKINNLETRITNLRKNMKGINIKYLSIDSKKDSSEFINDFNTLSKEIVDIVFDVANYSQGIEDFLKKCFEKSKENKIELCEEYKIELSNFINKFTCFSVNKNFCEKCEIMGNLANETAEFGIHWNKTLTALDNIQFCAQLVENIDKIEKDCQKLKNLINEMKEYSEKHTFSDKTEEMLV